MLNIKEKEFLHSCGCITIKYQDGVAFKKTCNHHKLNSTKKVYVALQYPTE